MSSVLWVVKGKMWKIISTCIRKYEIFLLWILSVALLINELPCIIRCSILRSDTCNYVEMTWILLGFYLLFSRSTGNTCSKNILNFPKWIRIWLSREKCSKGSTFPNPINKKYSFSYNSEKFWTYSSNCFIFILELFSGGAGLFLFASEH